MVAEDPVEIQFKFDDMGPWVNPRCVMSGGAGEKRKYTTE